MDNAEVVAYLRTELQQANSHLRPFRDAAWLSPGQEVDYAYALGIRDNLEMVLAHMGEPLNIEEREDRALESSHAALLEGN
jgi:hypothetical protein